ADALAVDAGHVVAGVAHDVIHGDLVARLAGDGLERVPQRVEVAVPVDAEGLQQLPGFVRDGRVFPSPAPTLFCDERQAGVGRVLRVGTRCQRLADRSHGFGPERAAPRDAGLGPGEGQPAAVKVQRGQGQLGAVAIAEATVDAE